MLSGFRNYSRKNNNLYLQQVAFHIAIGDKELHPNKLSQLIGMMDNSLIWCIIKCNLG